MTPAERTAAHEAGHACACVVLGVPVRLVDTVPRTEPTPGGGLRAIYGEVRHGLEQITSREDAHKRMIIILCGQIEGAEEWEDLPSWPLNPGASSDEHNLHALADYLGLDERGYSDLTFEALKLTLDRQYQMLHVAITGMLGYTPRIGPMLLDRLDRLARAD